jgi:two-component system, OmpR family, response regulator RstA
VLGTGSSKPAQNGKCPVERAAMDLAHARRRGYTGTVHQLPPHNHLRPAFQPAESVGALARADALRPARVQVLGDDDAAAAHWCKTLEGEGLATDRTSFWPDGPLLAVVLHVTRRLPDRLAQLRELRARRVDIPLVVVCQQLRDLDHVLALEMGADDVLDATTSAAVVAARLRALARRLDAAAKGSPVPEHLSFGALALFLRERRVRLNGADLPFTEGEFEVLWLLASQAGHAVSRADLLRRLRGLPYQRFDRSIDCRVYRIRAKLGDIDGPAQHIRTVRNCGYLFSPAAW